MNTIGKTLWALPGACIPFGSTGCEPQWTSHDKIAVLNASENAAELEIILFYEDKKPQGSYKIIVDSKRLRKIRFNDLINPYAIELAKPFGFILQSSQPVIVQFSRLDTRQSQIAMASSLAFACPAMD